MNFLSLLSNGVQLMLWFAKQAERRGHIETGMNKVLVARLSAVNGVLLDAKNLRGNLDDLERVRLRNKYARRDT